MYVACRRALRPAPARIPEGDLQELLESLKKQPASLANCFNTGICNWLCHHRCSDQLAALSMPCHVSCQAFVARQQRHTLYCKLRFWPERSRDCPPTHQPESYGCLYAKTVTDKMTVMSLAQYRIAMCRQSLQYALGMETILLVALFALYARYNRRARGLQMDAADEVIQLAISPLLSLPYVSAQHAKQLRAHLCACCPHPGRPMQAATAHLLPSAVLCRCRSIRL